MDEVIVSIICNTYNHAPYIQKALESFVNQMTEFRFEVLVHDDASNDETASIIKSYEMKYPDIIFPIYQNENQYSKHVRISDSFQYPRAKGKYIALCEGDDYWLDPYKLQKQYETMEMHPEIDICAHSVIKMRNDKRIGEISPRDHFDIISTDDVILGGGGFVGTSSLFFRKSILNSKPKFAQYMSLDYVIQIWGALRGGMLYLPDEMSVYRVGVNGSWSMRMGNNVEKNIKHIDRIDTMLQILDEETEGKYSDSIKKHIKENEFSLLEIQKKYDEMLNDSYIEIYKELSRKKRIKIRLKHQLFKWGFIR